MEIYLLNYILIIIEAAIFQLVPKLKKHNKAFLNIAFLQLFILLALRKDNIATDLETYKRVFFEISNTSWENVFNIAWEPLFIILCKVVVTLFNNFNVLLVIVALIGLIGPYSFIKRYSKNYYISVILFVGLYFYSSQFFILRQIIAISFLLMSIRYVEEKKLIKFICLVIIATLFHKSAICFFIVYPLSKIKLTQNTCIILSFIAIVTFFLKDIISGFIVNIIYKNYTDWVNADDGYFLLFAFLFIAAFALYMDKNVMSKKNKTIYICFYLAIIFQMLAISRNPFARIIWYFYIVLIVLLPNCIADTIRFNNKYKKILYICLIIVVSSYFVYTLYNDTSLYEYKFLWQ